MGLLMLLSTAWAVMDTSDPANTAKDMDIIGLLSLFLLFSLTFTVSLLGIKKLAERSPKKVLVPSSVSVPTEVVHEVISF